MNRLVLIGNGFDLAHGLKTSYADFIHWYKAYRVELLGKEHSNISSDPLCKIELLERHALSIYASNFFWNNRNVSHEDFFDYIVQNTHEFKVTFSPFFGRIINGIEDKGWVDIENEYYELLKAYSFPTNLLATKEETEANIKDLNKQLTYLKQLLVEYLKEATKDLFDTSRSIKDAIYAPFKKEDMSIEGEKVLDEHRKYWESSKTDEALEEKVSKFGYELRRAMNPVSSWRDSPKPDNVPWAFMIPDDIMFLNFNYTNTIKLYISRYYLESNNHIHGNINDLNSIIFGYGDELDSDFQKLKESNTPGCLQNVKSIRYLEAPNYRRVLSFIESAPFQVLIMGHSCGNSDRTLLNTIFEHKNCVSIKPYYYRNDEKGIDNYMELVQNISRNFTDMKLMRDRVVNKTQCEPLVKP